MNNSLLVIILALVLLAPSSAKAADELELNQLPTSLVRADIAYKRDGPEAYLAALLDNSIPDDVASKAALLEQAHAVAALLRQVESVYGRYLGIEVVESIQISDSTRVVYYVLKYGTGPVYGVLTIYDAEVGEIVSGFAINTELHKVVPPNLIINRAQSLRNGR
jgi:hypothetical protein